MEQEKKKIPEILAPCGSPEAVKGAINAGADAIYMGGNRFGARAYAANAEEGELVEMLHFVHRHGKRLYLTVNTLFKEKELEEELIPWLTPYYQEGLDAVIVQDFGVLRLVHETFPDLEIHASTQMTLTGQGGEELLPAYGVTRMVPARELSLEELRRLRERTSLELEVFVHGALCYCYSGQCLFSSAEGPRSGNRGRCAQPCRRRYGFLSGAQEGKKGYLLSPKDINTLEEIPDLIEAGIDSFKIEGRMKQPEYAALTTSLYRKYRDLYLEKGRENYQISKEDCRCLAEIYNRGGFSEGYLKTYHGPSMMSMDRPNHTGVLVGEVAEVRGNQAKVRLEAPVQPQDVLEFRRGQKALYEYTAKDGAKAGEEILARFLPGSGIRTTDVLYRTRDNVLRKKIQDEFLSQPEKLPLDAVLEGGPGERLRLCYSFSLLGNRVEGESISPEKLEAPRGQGTTKEDLNRLLSQTGETPYQVKQILNQVKGEVFVPVSVMKKLRREALGQLEEKIQNTKRRTGSIKNSIRNNSKDLPPSSGIMALDVKVEREEQAEAALAMEGISRIYYNGAAFFPEDLQRLFGRESSAEPWVVLPRVLRSPWKEKIPWDIYAAGKGVLTGSLDGLSAAKTHLSLPVQGDETLYGTNEEAVAWLLENGLAGLTYSPELSLKEQEEMQGCSYAETLVVYGRQPVMVSAQCLMHNGGAKGCTKEPAVCSLISLEREEKEMYPVCTRCQYCYNEIYGGKIRNLASKIREIQKLHPARIRLDFLTESKEEVQEVITLWQQLIQGAGEEMTLPGNYTLGHSQRGIQ